MNRIIRNGSNKNKAALIATGILVLAGWILVFLAYWVFTTWPGLRMDELIFQLKAPLEGTGDGLIMKGVLSSVVPALVMSAVCLAAYTLGTRKGAGRKVLFWERILGAVLILGTACFAWSKLELGSYLRNQMEDSSFIEDNYVDPADVSIRFPEKKRNLIYIYMESMEMTFSDPSSGGAFPSDLIPELTRISMESENFSGNSGLLNGGKVMPGTTFTMGGIFAQSAGLPLKIDLGEDFKDQRGAFNKMNTQDAFFEKVTNIGDILEEEGYRNVFMLGSNATFGGRRLYFSQHGNYEIDDYNWAVEQGLIPQDYYVFWGMEDEKLFAAARDRLTEISESGEPFNFTILTVDTHFEDGYMCDLCDPDQYPGNNYANVMACSSRQTAAFIEWVQKQDFYENTTIVLCGDHTTMDSDFCNNVPPDYDRRVYTAFINADAEPVDPSRCREYSTLDQFPTTLAALGCTIEGNRLGLGTNLFSGEDTLLEKYGVQKVAEEMDKKSNFMIDLADIDIYSEDLLEAQGKLPEGKIRIEAFDKASDVMTVSVSDIGNIYEKIKRVELVTDDGDGTLTIPMQRENEGIYRADLDISSFNYKNVSMTAEVTGKSGRRYTIATLTGDLSLKKDEICAYLDELAENPQYTIFVAVRDDASHSLNEEICMRLEALGLKEDLRGHYRWSYYGVITPDQVVEELSESELSRSGTLSDGASYSVISQGGLSGAGGGAGRYLTCSVKIDGVEYAVQRIGLNFVVYDTENSCVVDSCEFNTYIGLDPKRVDVADLVKAAETAREQMNIGDTN